MEFVIAGRPDCLDDQGAVIALCNRCQGKMISGRSREKTGGWATRFGDFEDQPRGDRPDRAVGRADDIAVEDPASDPGIGNGNLPREPLVRRVGGKPDRER